ncbi:MAG: hypothetical protein KIH67_000475 [Candidatus Moranbacteria bacterium]|nr:hypothetical protein [Candidatus Moranbacteria bacterium]
MLTRLEKKIQFIREQPESVRMRYLFICLFASMFFILVIWLFSLKESVSEITKTKIVLPENKMEEGQSLESLLNKDIPLRIQNQNGEGDPLKEVLKKETESQQ